MNREKEKKEPTYKMFSQCPTCLTIEVDVGQRMPVYQTSMVRFENLPQKRCIRHKEP